MKHTTGCKLVADTEEFLSITGRVTLSVCVSAVHGETRTERDAAGAWMVRTVRPAALGPRAASTMMIVVCLAACRGEVHRQTH